MSKKKKINRRAPKPARHTGIISRSAHHTSTCVQPCRTVHARSDQKGDREPECRPSQSVGDLTFTADAMTTLYRVLEPVCCTDHRRMHGAPSLMKHRACRPESLTESARCRFLLDCVRYCHANISAHGYFRSHFSWLTVKAGLRVRNSATARSVTRLQSFWRCDSSNHIPPIAPRRVGSGIR